MAVITGGPLNGVPFEWILGILLLAIVATVTVSVWRIRKQPEKARGPGENPTETNMIALNPVDQNGNPVMGKLLANVIVTDADIVFKEPGIMDKDKPTEEKEFHATHAEVTPLPLRDEFGNLVNLWGVLKMQGEYVLYSFTDLAKRIRMRFDPLEADPRDVGQHFIGGPPRLGGLPQLLQSTTGKVILIGGSVVGGMFFMFFLVVVSGHWH